MCWVHCALTPLFPSQPGGQWAPKAFTQGEAALRRAEVSSSCLSSVKSSLCTYLFCFHKNTRMESHTPNHKHKNGKRSPRSLQQGGNYPGRDEQQIWIYRELRQCLQIVFYTREIFTETALRAHKSAQSHPCLCKVPSKSTN